MIILSFACYSIITRYMAFKKDETINRKNKLINFCFLFYLILYGFECDQTGIAMGPSILGKFSALAATIYPKKSLYLSKTLGNFACLRSLHVPRWSQNGFEYGNKSRKKGTRHWVMCFLIATNAKHSLCFHFKA